METNPSLTGCIFRTAGLGIHTKLGRHLALVFLLLLCPRLIPQDFYQDQTKAVANAMLTKTGLHLPKGMPDILSLIDHQSKQSECEVIDVRWISLPGSDSIPANRTSALSYPQTFSQVARRRHSGCDRASYRAYPSDFPFVQFIVFGTTNEGEIRGLHADRDPREWIAECPELFGGKSTADTVCGVMVRPEVTASIHMPQDKQITLLVFFLRRFTTPNEWDLERLGALDLGVVREQ